MVAVLLQVAEIGSDDIDAEQLGVGKHHTGVDNDDIVAVLQHHRVHPELA